MGIYFFVSGLMNALRLFLLKVCVSYGIWPTPLLYLSSEEREQGSLYCGTRGIHVSNCPVTAAWKHLLAMQDQCPPLKLILLCLFSIRVEPFFYPVLHYVVFSLATHLSRCSGQKCLESSPGISNWCMVSTPSLLGLITTA